MNLKDRIILALKGVAMGAADVVPGVSGGTIAFITGIYEELINTISGLGIQTLQTLRKEGIKAAWKQANAGFLVNLLLGIFLAIISLAKLISYLLETHPIAVWSFFFGLIIASVFVVGKQVKNRLSLSSILALLIGTGIAYYITLISPVSGNVTLPYAFLCGVLAITAMILPGISGSFILLLLGAYSAIIGSINGFTDALRNGDSGLLIENGKLLLSFVGGCIVGLLSFSRVLSWLFKRAHDITVSLLTGFLIGSLNKIWPWKFTEEVFVKHQGTDKEEIVPLVQSNVLPAEWADLHGEPSQLFLAIAMCAVGFILIMVMDRWSPVNRVK